MVNHSCELCTSLGVETKFWTLTDRKTHAQLHAFQLTRISDDGDQPSVKEIFGKCFPLDNFEKSEEIEKSRSTLFKICKDIVKSKKNDSNSIECQQCGSNVRYKRKSGTTDVCLILYHATTHSTKKPFICRECKLDSPTKIGMERHINQFHKIASPLSGEHFDENWTDCFDEMKESVMKCFGDLKLDPGSSSKFRRTPPSELAVQRRLIFKKIIKSTDNAEKIKCAQCQKEISATHTGHLEEHIRTHLDRPIFECSKCDVSFRHLCTIVGHLRKEHGVSSKGNYIDRSEAHHEEILDLAKKCFGKKVTK